MVSTIVTAVVTAILTWAAQRIAIWTKERAKQKQADERAKAEAAAQADKLKKAQTSTDGDQVEDGIKDSLGQL